MHHVIIPAEGMDWCVDVLSSTSKRYFKLIDAYVLCASFFLWMLFWMVFLSCKKKIEIEIKITSIQCLVQVDWVQFLKACDERA